MAKLSKYAKAALNLINAAARLGWVVSVRGPVLTITKTILKDNSEDFAQADSEYSAILSLAQTTQAGSEWGTDGGGMGAYGAMKRGVFTMNKSGVSKRILNALEKALKA